ncbi:MAG: response regulator [Fuerstiella sp.]
MTNLRKALIVDDDLSTTQLILTTLNDAQMPYVLAGSNAEAWQVLQQDPAVSLVLLRGYGDRIQGVDLCRQIRSVHPVSDLPVLILLRESEMASGAEFLIAGATDLLIGTFEPRELRMRAKIVPPDQVKRIDAPHTTTTETGPTRKSPTLYVPEFDASSHRFTFGVNEAFRAAWERDPRTRTVPLDKIIVCPECDGIPTFRPGCGACGSAWVEQVVMIHHYACAHVAPEQEFRTEDGLVCPKCRLDDLVAGSDFELLPGSLRCADCAAVFTEMKMVAHCLACQHRFMAEDGRVQELRGYQVAGSSSSPSVVAPTFRRADSSSTTVAEVH